MRDTPLEQLIETLHHVEQDLKERTENKQKSRHDFSKTMKIIFAFLGCLALANIYFVNSLTQEIKVMISSMVEMYEHFGRMSDQMQDMTTYVKSMENDIEMMVIMKKQMGQMNGEVFSMTQDMNAMSHDMENMDVRIYSMNINVQQMAQRFRHMNMNVGNMGYNVNQMSNVVPGGTP